MNLTKLFEAQKQLDERIVKDKGLEGQDLLPMKILALQVELGELANEWRGFKFWSNNQKPNGEKHGIYSDGSRVKNPLLEEYVDCLHFILSIGNDLIHRGGLKLESVYVKHENIVGQFNLLFSVVGELWDHGELDENYGAYISSFIELGEMLGFNREQIEQAYYAKNQINHDRQSSGY